jgi:hypothetical protein
MAEQKIARAPTFRSPNKSSWLTALHELEQEFKRRGGAASPAHADVAPASSAPEQLALDLREGS